MAPDKPRPRQLALVALFWLAAWQGLAMALGHGGLFLATPLQTLQALAVQLPTAEFWHRIAFSALRILAGFGLAVVCGLALGAAGARWVWVRRLIAPPMALIRAMPVASFVILALLWVSSANLSVGGVQFSDDFDPDTHNDCRVQRELTEKWHNYNDGQIRIDASIHGEYTSHKELWQWMAGYAREHKLGMHVHISETKAEHEACIARHGKTPIQILNDYGVWDTRAIAAHCVWTTPEDWAIMAEKGISAIHNPISNLKLGSGIAPIPAMKKAGVNVCLGTDGVSSNNCTDFFSDLKFAAILHNGANCDPLALLPADALRMATRDGGAALGRKTGMIQGGYEADLILVDFSHLNLTPCHSVLSNLAYAAHGTDVCMNMARGKVIYKDGDFLTIDLERVRREVADYALPLLFQSK